MHKVTRFRMCGTVAAIAELNPEHHGWNKDTANRCMIPTALSPEVLLAPEYLLKVTYCGCSSENLCQTLKCGCKNSDVRCSALYKCGGTCDGNGIDERATDSSEEVDDNESDEDESDADDE